jgi:hypothetical protein
MLGFSKPLLVDSVETVCLLFHLNLKVLVYRPAAREGFWLQHFLLDGETGGRRHFGAAAFVDFMSGEGNFGATFF